jgi:hypothetical protein
MFPNAIDYFLFTPGKQIKCAVLVFFLFPLFMALYKVQTIILPRQARDKHRANSRRKRGRLSLRRV